MFPPIGYPIKLLIKYILIITISFIVTIPFGNNYSGDAYFINISFNHFEADLDRLINRYLKRDQQDQVVEEIKKIGSLFYPYFFKRIESDAARKDEYITLYHQLELELFDVPETHHHEIGFYQEQWGKIASKYQEESVIKLLQQWTQGKLSQKQLLADIEATGTYAVPIVLDYLMENRRLLIEGRGRFLLTFLNEEHVDFPRKNKMLLNSWQLSWEWWQSYYLTHRNYYREITGLNRIGFIFTETRFFVWIKQCFSFDFGVENNQPIYRSVGERFFRTALFALLILMAGFFLSLSLLLINTRNRKRIIFKILDRGMMFANLIPFSIVIILFYTLWQYQVFRGETSGFFYGFAILGMILIPFFYVEFKIILRRNLNTLPLETQQYFRSPPEIIFKKYLYRGVLLQGLNHIFKQFPFILALILITDFLMESGGLGELLFDSLQGHDLFYLKLSLLSTGLLLMLFQMIFDMINFIYYQRVKPDDYQTI